MYNGIGILTPRGSGTSGYVQGNKFNLRRAPPVRHDAPQLGADDGPTSRQPNKEILDHNKKREIELKIAHEESKLEEEGCGLGWEGS